MIDAKTTTATTTTTTTAPWYLHLVVGGGIWLGASLLALGLALLLSVIDSGAVMLIISIPLLAGTFGVSRLPPAIFRDHVLFALSLSGQTTFLIAVSMILSLGDESVALLAIAIQVVSLFTIPNFLHRVVAYFALGGAIVMLSSATEVTALNHAYFLFSAAVVLVGFGLPHSSFLRERIQQNELVKSIRVAAILVVVVVATGISLVHRGAENIFDAVVLATFLLLFFFWATDGKERDRYKVGAGAAIVVVVILLTRGNLILLVSFLLLGLSHHDRRRTMGGLGILTLAMGLAWTYYSLNTTLMMKSLVVTGTGIGLLVAYAFVRRLLSPTSSTPADSFSLRRKLSREAMLLAGAALVVVATLGGLSLQKEHQKRNGVEVLLAIAPKDPRSIMQGDYMTLRTRIAAEQKTRTEDGFLVAALDENHVATFIRFDDDKSTFLSPGEVRLQYRIRKGTMKIGATEFFFQEGKGRHFAAARFAEMRVSSSGKLLLVGLRDADRNPL